MSKTLKVVIPETGEVKQMSLSQGQRMFNLQDSLIDKEILTIVKKRNNTTIILIFETLEDLEIFTDLSIISNGFEDQEDRDLFPDSALIEEQETIVGKQLKPSSRAVNSPIFNRFAYGLLPPNARV